MANQQERLQEATRHLSTLESEHKTRLEALEARLAAAEYDRQKTQIQQRIDQLEKIYESAIGRAKIDLTKLEAEVLVQQANQEAKLGEQRAAQESEIKTRGMAEWVRAGGDPRQFEAAWPTIRHTILNERVINALVVHQKNDGSITL